MMFTPIIAGGAASTLGAGAGTSDSPLSVPDVTLTVARGAGGGDTGGTNALSWSALDGNTSNGSRIRITSDGTFNLGTKPGGAHELHDFGHTAYERGVENTFNSGIADDTDFLNTEPDRIWSRILNSHSGPNPVLKSDSSEQRHSNASRFYRLFGGQTSLREPKAYEDVGRSAGHQQLYHAWWQRSKYNTAGWRSLAPTDLSGTFQPGEELSVNGGEFSGVYVAYDTSTVFNSTVKPHRVIIENGSKNNSNLDGKVVTGLTSGATMTFENGSFPGQAKMGRYWDNPDGSGLRSSIAINDFYVGGIPYFYDTVNFVPGQWHFFELELDLATGFVRHTVDGRVRGEMFDYGPIGDTNFSPAISQIGPDISIEDEFPDQVTDFAEHVFDRTLYRVYLADAADWSSVTHREVQRLITWDGSVDVALNYGALSSGWLYLIGADGQPINTTGLELQL